MKVEERAVSSLRPAAENPRVIDEAAVAQVSRSIKTYGFLVPLIVSASGEVVCGHVRLRAAVALGLDTVPCVLADGLSEAQVRKFRIVENRVSESAGEWDIPALAGLVSELKLDPGWFNLDFDLSAFGAPPVEVGVDEAAVDALAGAASTGNEAGDGVGLDEAGAVDEGAAAVDEGAAAVDEGAAAADEGAASEGTVVMMRRSRYSSTVRWLEASLGAGVVRA